MQSVYVYSLTYFRYVVSAGGDSKQEALSHRKHEQEDEVHGRGPSDLRAAGHGDYTHEYDH